jgi:hypothetical protein
MKMLDYQHWLQLFLVNPGYNDAGGVIIAKPFDEPEYEALGIHQLENGEKPGIFLAILDRENNIIPNAVIHHSKLGDLPACPAEGDDAFRSEMGAHNAHLYPVTGIPCTEPVFIESPGGGRTRLWHPAGEGVMWLQGDKTYLIVFKKVKWELDIMLDIQYWNNLFLTNPGYNDAKSLGVTINRVSNAKWRAIGVHHLTGDENRGNHNIFCDVLNKEGQRVNGARLKMIQGEVGSVFATIDKPAYEPGTNFPVWDGAPVSVSVAEGLSDSFDGMSTLHPDEDPGNYLAHHSFYVVFQENGGPVDPPPDDKGELVPIFPPAPKVIESVLIKNDETGVVSLVVTTKTPIYTDKRTEEGNDS